jgi:hypothetical protein
MLFKGVMNRVIKFIPYNINSRPPTAFYRLFGAINDSIPIIFSKKVV